ncbi:MAG: 16S rRNA (guanine(527)-N(7))-methyltransferase RsmG [Pseudomonadota bacterium]
MNLAEELGRGLSRIGLALTPETQQKLLDYVALLAKWNKVHNLTAVREPARMVSHHLLDSLVVVPYLQGAMIVDVGSGGGLPGIPLALVKPEWQVTLLEANQKKAAFLRQVLIELKLANVQVVCERVESWRPEKKFEIVISRAFADIVKFVQLAGHLCAPQGRLYAMKGVMPLAELAQLPEGVTVEQVVALDVPQLDAERHLVVMKLN